MSSICQASRVTVVLTCIVYMSWYIKQRFNLRSQWIRLINFVSEYRFTVYKHYIFHFEWTVIWTCLRDNCRISNENNCHVDIEFICHDWFWNQWWCLTVFTVRRLCPTNIQIPQWDPGRLWDVSGSGIHPRRTTGRPGGIPRPVSTLRTDQSHSVL